VRPATKLYDDGDFSFNYPTNWVVKEQNKQLGMVVFSNAEINYTIKKQQIPLGYKLKEHIDKLIFPENSDSSFQFVRKRNFEVDGVSAYEITYKLNSGNESFLRKELWFEKDGYLCSIISTYPKERLVEFLVEKQVSNSTGKLLTEKFLSVDLGFSKVIEGDIGNSEAFKTIIRTFSIKNPEMNSYPFSWGKLIIPKIGLECSIRSDTVNEYNSVYHYPGSVYPGEMGECGIMGHYTQYSAPLSKIDQIKPGDQIFIDDLLAMKKYVYTVVSNGEDIRWDYLKNPIKFEQSGEPRLLLVTCFPPGRTSAAWILHARLTSVLPSDL